jgi:hypothetical protein
LKLETHVCIELFYGLKDLNHEQGSWVVQIVLELLRSAQLTWELAGTSEVRTANENWFIKA